MTLEQAVETIITAEIFNRNKKLDEDDLPPKIRKKLWKRNDGGVDRPVKVTEKELETRDLKKDPKTLPFIDFDPITDEYLVTVLETGVDWLIKKDTLVKENNPAIAYYLDKEKKLDIDYEEIRSKNPPKEVSREWVESLMEKLSEEEENAEEMLELVHVLTPNEVKQTLDNLVLTEEQRSEIKKIMKAIEYREHLREIGLIEVGKLLFIGPPGTGKTSTARALSERLSLPLLEVKLSRITSQYLGETSKNIDKTFELAKKLSPCILFIDEFDFVAKTRTSDEHAALKRAVNTLLKDIDEISLIHDGVLLIGATNHPKLLDSAVWRRFDEIVHFPLPDQKMRKKILEKVLEDIEGEIDYEEVSKLTDGFSGADLRLIIREAVLKALCTDRTFLTQEDLSEAVKDFKERDRVRNNVVEKMDSLEGLK